MLFKGFLDPQNKFLFYLKKKKNHNQAQYIHTHKFTIVEMICYDIDI